MILVVVSPELDGDTTKFQLIFPGSLIRGPSPDRVPSSEIEEVVDVDED